MIELEEESIRQWSLTLSDNLSTKFKTNFNFKDFESEEIIYSEFLENNSAYFWTTLCEETETKQNIIIPISYSSIIASTNSFFSNTMETELPEEDLKLSFSETFFAQEISNEILTAFTDNGLTIQHLRNEPELKLVHPFHEDESITTYSFKWYINEDSYGDLLLCHSHVL